VSVIWRKPVHTYAISAVSLKASENLVNSHAKQCEGLVVNVL